MAKKPSIGRQKIKIAKIELKNHLQVTFSKRRSGLFKKASEFCTLCGVDVVIIVFSPAEKVFSFGHPNVDSVINRSLPQNAPQDYTMHHLLEAQRSSSVLELNFRLDQILNELEAEKRKGETLEDMRKASEKTLWWESPLDKLGLSELEQLRISMEELKKNVENQTNKLLIEGVTNFSTFFLVNGSVPADQIENKPTHNHSFGYDHGYFEDFFNLFNIH